jgi:hypothetical protein
LFESLQSDTVELCECCIVVWYKLKGHPANS